MKIRDRIRELRRVRAGELLPNPKNWRIHTDKQRARLEAVLRKIGYADVILVRQRDDKQLQIIDGHLRADLDPDQIVPVLILDVSEKEADVLLATLDPLAEMAQTDAEKLAELAAELVNEPAQDPELQAMFFELAPPPPDAGDVELKALDTMPPPKMAWVLLGIPTVRFAEIAEAVESLAAVPEVIVESTVNGSE